MPRSDSEAESAVPTLPPMTNHEAIAIVLESAGAGELDQAPILPPRFISVLRSEISVGTRHARRGAEPEFPR